jgi:hypothetical protein
MRVCRQTDQSESEAVRQSHLVKSREVEEPHCCKPLHSNAELVVRQSPASKDMNTEAEEATALETVTRRQTVNTQQVEKSLCVL